MRARSTSPRQRTRSRPRPGRPPARPPPLPLGRGCRPRTAPRHGRQQLGAGATCRSRAPERGRGTRSQTAGRRAGAPRAPPPRAARRRDAQRVQPLRRHAQRRRGAVGALELGGDAGTGLGHRGAETREPRGQALMGVGAGRQRHGRVRGLADQRVPEAERALTLDQRLCRQHSSRRTSSSSVRSDSRRRCRARAHRARRGGTPLPLDRRRLDQPALRRAQRVETRREQRMQGRWEPVLLAALGDVGRELLQEQRVPARSRDDASDGRFLERRLAGEQAAARRRVHRRQADPSRAGPRGPGAQQLRPTDAQDEDGRRDRAPTSSSTRSSSGGSAQWASSSASRSGRSRASASRSIRNAHGAASAGACRRAPASPRSPPPRRALVGRLEQAAPAARPRCACSTISRSGQ